MRHQATVFLTLALSSVGARGTSCADFLREENSDRQNIQNVVDTLGLDIVVVGSAARGERRHAGINVPIGKGAHEKSDIDYLIPVDFLSTQEQVLTSLLFRYERRQDSILRWLPDRGHPVLTGLPREERHRIWFRPGAPPQALGPGQPNLAIRPWALGAFPAEDVQFELQRLEEFIVPKLNDATELRRKDVSLTLTLLKAEMSSRELPENR